MTVSPHHHFCCRSIWRGFLLWSGMKVTYLPSSFPGQSHFYWHAWWLKFRQVICCSSSAGLSTAHKAGKSQMCHTNQYIWELIQEALIKRPCIWMLLRLSSRSYPGNLFQKLDALFPISLHSCPLNLERKIGGMLLICSYMCSYMLKLFEISNSVCMQKCCSAQVRNTE